MSVWAGVSGPKRYICPHCQGIWDGNDVAEYDKHMSENGYPASRTTGTIVAVDPYAGTVTVKTDEAGGEGGQK